jgi:hypothetical protein
LTRHIPCVLRRRCASAAGLWSARHLPLPLASPPEIRTPPLLLTLLVVSRIGFLGNRRPGRNTTGTGLPLEQGTSLPLTSCHFCRSRFPRPVNDPTECLSSARVPGPPAGCGCACTRACSSALPHVSSADIFPRQICLTHSHSLTHWSYGHVNTVFVAWRRAQSPEAKDIPPTSTWMHPLFVLCHGLLRPLPCYRRETSRIRPIRESEKREQRHYELIGETVEVDVQRLFVWASLVMPPYTCKRHKLSAHCTMLTVVIDSSAHLPPTTPLQRPKPHTTHT